MPDIKVDFIPQLCYSMRMKYTLRLLIAGQLLLVLFLILTGTPAPDWTLKEAVGMTIGWFVVIDIAGLSFAWFCRRLDFESESKSVKRFLGEVW